MANRTDTQSVVNLVINGQQAMTTMRQLTDTQRRLNTEMRDMRPADPRYPEMLRQIRQVNRAISEQRAEMNDLNEEAEELRLNWKEIAAGILTVEGIKKVGSWITDTGKAIKDAFVETQRFTTILTTAFKGNADFAKLSMKMLQDFAAKTPYQLEEITGGYIKLVNRGFVPTYNEMVKMGDLAASQGKTFDQYVEALLDAQTGEFERLKEFGIKASKNGDTVSLSFKGVTKEVKNSESAIREAMLAFGDMEGVKNSMKDVSAIVAGMESNIEDTWDQIFSGIGKRSSGMITMFYSTYGKLLDWFKEKFIDVSLSEEMENERMELIKLELQLQSANTTQEERVSIINKLQEQYPAYFKNMDAEKVTTTELAVAFQKLNTEYLNKIVLQKQGEELAKAEDKRAELRLTQAKKESEIRDYLARIKDKSPNIQLFGATDIDKARTLLMQLQTSGDKAFQGVSRFAKNDLKNLLADFDYIDDKFLKQTGVSTKLMNEREKLAKSLGIDATQDLTIKTVVNPITPAAESTKLSKEAEAAQKKLQQEHDKLIELAKKMQLEADINNESGLDKKLAEIAKKYDPLIKQAEKFKDEAVKGIIGALKQEQIDMATAEIDQEIQAAIDKSKEDSFKSGTDWLNKENTKGKSAINNDLANQLGSIDSETAMLSAQEEAQRKERELTEQHLIATKLLYETYGKDATDIDTQLTDIRLKNAEREATGKIAYTQAKQEIDEAYLASSQEAVGVLKGLVGQQNLLYKGLIVADKALAIAKIMMNTQTEISGYYAKYSLVPGGFAIASGLASAAKVRSGISIGLVAATGIAELVQSASASKTERGKAYATGVTNASAGRALVGEKGRELIEANGKWFIADQPRLADLPQGANVYNNAQTERMLSDKSLGEQLYPKMGYSINLAKINEAERNYRSPGTPLSGTGSAQTNNSAPSPAPVININNDAMLEKLDELRDAMAAGFVFDYRAFSEFKAKIDKARDSQSG